MAIRTEKAVRQLELARDRRTIFATVGAFFNAYTKNENLFNVWIPGSQLLAARLASRVVKSVDFGNKFRSSRIPPAVIAAGTSSSSSSGA